MRLNRKLHVPLYIQLKDEILVAIKSDQYAIGDMIPSEQEMMKTYHVGRATVREAINELVKEGFLEKHQGKGTFIRRKNTSLGFEPLISLSYALGIRGWQHHNDLLEQKQIDNTPELEALTQVKSSELFYLERNRFIDAHPLGLERFYFHSDFTDMAEKAGTRLQESIGKLMLETLKLPVEKMLQEVIIVKANEREATLLKLAPESDLMFMKRWIFIHGYEGAFQYYEFKVPVGVSAFPTEFL